MKKRSVIAIAALAAMSFQVLATTPFSVTSRDISGERRWRNSRYLRVWLPRWEYLSAAGMEKSARGYEKFCRHGI
jgi:hypothetical protein